MNKEELYELYENQNIRLDRLLYMQDLINEIGKWVLITSTSIMGIVTIAYWWL